MMAVPKVEAARRFDLGRQTVYRYLAATRKGMLAPKKTGGIGANSIRKHSGPMSKNIPMPPLRNFKKCLGSAITRSGSGWGNWMSHLKKLEKYRERNEVQRWLFRRELEKLEEQPVFHLDECGVDHRLDREYGRSPRGERIDQAVAGKRRERNSIIAASRQNKLVAPLVFGGSCNTEMVDVYFEKVLLPALPSGSVIVLDNARFHQSPMTQSLVEAAGCR